LEERKTFLLNLNELAQNRGEYHSLKENFKISKLIQKFLCEKPFFYFWRFFWWKATMSLEKNLIKSVYCYWNKENQFGN
jgi:hypothetical protein